MLRVQKQLGPVVSGERRNMRFVVRKGAIRLPKMHILSVKGKIYVFSTNSFENFLLHPKTTCGQWELSEFVID
jgi:hypothetical protein